MRSVKNDEDYDDYSGKFFATSEVRSHKGGISYDELRKYMWSWNFEMIIEIDFILKKENFNTNIILLFLIWKAFFDNLVT